MESDKNRKMSISSQESSFEDIDESINSNSSLSKSSKSSSRSSSISSSSSSSRSSSNSYSSNSSSISSSNKKKSKRSKKSKSKMRKSKNKRRKKSDSMEEDEDGNENGEIKEINGIRYDQIKIEEEEVPKWDTEEEANTIEPKNSLTKEVPDKFLKMTPFELFLFYFDDLAEKFASYSNKYALDKYQWLGCNISKHEILKYMFIYIYLSICDLPVIEMLWENSKFFKSIVPSILSKKRYITINKYFSTSEIFTEDRKSKSQKVNELIECLNKKWKETFPYTKNLSIDEAMTSYKGNICFKQYMKKKHKRFGIKLFSKASADKGYCYHMLLYTGKDFKYDKTCGMGTTIIKQLTKEHENQGFHITFDSYFSNLHTFFYLEQNKIKFTCTFALNNKTFSKEFKQLNLRVGETKYFCIKNTKIKLFISREKNRQIQLASNNEFDIQKKKYKNKKNKVLYKHEIVANYNLTKSGVDLIDAATQIYKTQRKTNKWWKAVFFYLLDVTLNNCCILYYSNNKYHNLNERNRSLIFRRILIQQFVESYNKCLMNNTINIVKEVHIMYPIKDGYKPCSKCTENKESTPQNTKFICNVCKIPLCQKCFVILHKNL